MPSNRRAFLKSCAPMVIGSLAGCNVQGSVDPADTTSTSRGSDDLKLGEETSLYSGQIAVNRIWVQQMVVAMEASAHTEVYASEGEQYVIADISAKEIDANSSSVRNAVKLDLGGTTYEPLNKHLSQHTTTSGRVAIPYAVPRDISASTGHVVLETDQNERDARWQLDGKTTSILAKPPRFTVNRFAVPDQAKGNDSIDVLLTIENAGKSDGSFIAEIGSTELSDQAEFNFSVSSGEETTKTVP
ncbi:MAG: hypothetical protein ABEI52_02360, partial [Halobacteriaceae archaeon]